MALDTVLQDRYEDGLFDVCWELWIILSRRHWFNFSMVVPPCLQGRIWDAEQLPSCQQFIGNATQGILVTLWAGQPLKLFRGHVWGRPTGANEPGTDARQEYRNTEVGQHYITFLIEKNVFR